MYFLPNCTVFYFYSRYFQPSADATYVKGAVTFIIVFSLCCVTSLVVAISLPPVCDVTMGEDDAEPLTGTTSPASPRALPSAERPLLPSSGCRLQLPLWSNSLAFQTFLTITYTQTEKKKHFPFSLWRLWMCTAQLDVSNTCTWCFLPQQTKFINNHRGFWQILSPDAFLHLASDAIWPKKNKTLIQQQGDVSCWTGSQLVQHHHDHRDHHHLH